MLIRWAKENDKPAWLALSREYDNSIIQNTDDIEQWYDGFDTYVGSKITKYNAIAAVDRMRGNLHGMLTFSKTNNKITFFAISHHADFERTAERLLTVALRQLNTNKDITAWLPTSTDEYLLKAIDMYRRFGFIENGEAEEAGVKGSSLVRPATNEKRGGSFHYDYDSYLKYSQSENCLCGTNPPPFAGEVDIHLQNSCLSLERKAQGKLFGKCYVITKNHHVDFEEIPFNDMTGFMRDIQRVGRALHKVTGAIKINYEIHANTGPHIHCHLFPRYLDDDFPSAPIDYRVIEPSPYESDEEFDWFVEQMRIELGVD